MTSEAIAVNGSHEPDVDKDEKILKPKKSILTSDEDEKVLQNGSNENGSVSENGENDNIENGYEGEIQNGEVSKQNKRSLRQKNLQEKRESTPNRQSLFREAKTVKESTPKPETPPKRELRQREVTPMKSTPKPEIQSKRESKPRGTPSKVNSSESNSEQNLSKSHKDSKEGGSEQKIDETSSSDTIEYVENEKETSLKMEECVVRIEESIVEDDNLVRITESEEEIVVKEKPQEKGFFSSFRRSSRRSSLEIKDACEASSSSVTFDSPSHNEEKIIPSKDIRGRKPINSFSRFPGRNVSISSIDKTTKRKADDSFDDENLKRFAGETASGSEKSPGWHFFSPSFKGWSPSQSYNTRLPTSTPFHKREEQDSMAVNFDSKTKLDLDDSMENENTVPTKQKANDKWCEIM